MLISGSLSNLTTRYTQQPLLRIITHLNTNILPSLLSARQRQQQEVDQSSKPTLSSMDLSFSLNHVRVLLEPSPHKSDREKLELHVGSIELANSDGLRPYAAGQEEVIVQTYAVRIEGVTISAEYLDIQKNHHSRILTNELRLSLETHIISNPLYYL